MDELIKLVQEKTGIGEEQARGAAETVLNYVKAKLPPDMAGMVDGVIGGGSAGANPLGGLGNLGGLGGS